MEQNQGSQEMGMKNFREEMAEVLDRLRHLDVNQKNDANTRMNPSALNQIFMHFVNEGYLYCATIQRFFP